MRKTKKHGWQFYVVSQNLLNDSSIRTDHRSQKKYALADIAKSKKTDQSVYTSTLAEARKVLTEYFKDQREFFKKQESQIRKLEKVHKLKRSKS